MERKIANPWKWQDAIGFVQANEVAGVQRMVFCAGQFSGDTDGRPMYPGDMRAQLDQALDNLETVLSDTSLTLADVVRLNYYTTNVEAFLEEIDRLARRLEGAGCRPASTLVGVTRLAFPEMLVEIEATAVA